MESTFSNILEVSMKEAIYVGSNISSSSNQAQKLYVKSPNFQLISAAHEGNINLAKTALERGADIETTHDCEMTSIFIAIDFGHSKMVRFLIESGANVDAQSKDGITPLMWAALHRKYSIIKILLEEAKADPTQVDNLGATVRDYMLIYRSQTSDKNSLKELASTFTLISKAKAQYQGGSQNNKNSTQFFSKNKPINASQKKEQNVEVELLSLLKSKCFEKALSILTNNPQLYPVMDTPENQDFMDDFYNYRDSILSSSISNKK